MYTGSREFEETEYATPSVNPLDNQPPNVGRERDALQLLRDIADALQHIVRTIHVTTSVPTVRQAPIKELQKYGATKFQGLKGVDPSAAENWMETTKRVLRATIRLHPPKESDMCCITVTRRSLSLVGIYEFQKKYIGELYIEEKKQEFLVLKQGNMSVLDYEREFSRLSRYASEYVPTEADSCKRFLRGLRDEIKIQLVSLRITELVDLVERAKMIEQVLGLDKKSEMGKSAGKRMGTTSSNPLPKRFRESRSGWRSSFRSDRDILVNAGRKPEDVSTVALLNTLLKIVRELRVVHLPHLRDRYRLPEVEEYLEEVLFQGEKELVEAVI
ncbi:uncharacterized protein LOC128283922 [Gossypium arboreum]|uniref:uncharacterized protein LOC128283922 n=1 Tax=Gossypium arboreum TaxID=29729 RepID=UPI0022F192AC|nr:uncharacterized protein LOC128283922 [Gossypium arboreum]